MTVWSAGARVRSRLSRYTQLSAPMSGRVHMTPATVASATTAKPAIPHRMRMPRRSARLNGTASTLAVPLFSGELFPDVPLELAEVEVAASNLGRTEVLHGCVVLPRDVAELLHRAVVRARQALLALRQSNGGIAETGIETDRVVEIRRRRGHANAHVRLAIPLQHDVARVLDLGGVVHVSPPLLLRPRDELLIVLDV